MAQISNDVLMVDVYFFVWFCFVLFCFCVFVCCILLSLSVCLADSIDSLCLNLGLF